MGINERRAVMMNPAEVDAFLQEERTTTMCSMHPDGSIHAVAMSYGFLDGNLAVETKRKSQKVQNLLRDPRLTFLVDAGDHYENLRGVELVGTARIIEEPDAMWEFATSMWERFIGPYTEDQRPLVEAMMQNRVVVTIDVSKVVSWDHRKLAQTSAAGAAIGARRGG